MNTHAIHTYIHKLIAIPLIYPDTYSIYNIHTKYVALIPLITIHTYTHTCKYHKFHIYSNGQIFCKMHFLNAIDHGYL